MDLEITIAAASGFFASISACTIPVYPILLNHLTRTRENPKWMTLFFTLGLASVYFIIYAAMGLLVTTFGFSFVETIDTWRSRLLLVGAITAWTMAVITAKGKTLGKTIRILDYDAGTGYLGALATGILYGTILTPCNMPFMFTGILPALSTQKGMLGGLILLAVFSIAYSLPLLLLGWMSGRAIKSISIVKNNMEKVERVSAYFLFLAGAYFLYAFIILNIPL